MRKYNVPIYYQVDVQVEANSDEEAMEIADAMCINITAKLDNYQPLEVIFNEIGLAEEL